jgi:hypothetical protein
MRPNLTTQYSRKQKPQSSNKRSGSAAATLNASQGWQGTVLCCKLGMIAKPHGSELVHVWNGSGTQRSPSQPVRMNRKPRRSGHGTKLTFTELPLLDAMSPFPQGSH